MNLQSLESREAVLATYSRHISAAHLDWLSGLGVKIIEEKREGAKIFDDQGKAYFDCYCSGGQFVLGHRKPEMVEALKSAVRECDLGNFVLLSAQKAALAKKLAEIAPGDLKCTVYGVCRGESNDFAMKLARGYSGRKEIVCFSGASHGQTGFALSASDSPDKSSLFGPVIPQVKRLPLDASLLKKNITEKTAIAIVEPVQSDAGVVIPPEGFLAELRKVCDRTGAALAFDEGQCGFGRTGKMFASSASGVVPDILSVGKAMGGTVYPISATVFTSKLNRFMLKHPLIHLSTFGGADVGCLVALAAIEHICREKLWENAMEQGDALLDGLKDIALENKDNFKDARGIGLLTGIEAWNKSTARKFTAALAKNGVIALPAPGNPSVVRFTPPIDITEDEVDAIIAAASDAAESLK